MECRTCLNITNDYRDLFTEDCDLPHKIEAISSIQILVKDQFPSKICHECVTNVELLYDFRGMVRRSDMVLENRTCKIENQDNWKTSNRSQSVEPIEDDLIQIDEIKLESEIENSDLDDSVRVKPEVIKIKVSKRKTKPGKKSVKKKVYNCTKCDFTAEQYKFLRTHQRIHKVEEELRSICNVCGKLISIDNFSHHLAIHNATPVTCYICEKVLKHKGRLRKHLEIHKGITFQCTYCEKICNSRQTYYKHVRRHKNGGAKTEKCPMCEKLFHEKKFLIKHIRSHTGERPYPCEYCKKGFSSPYALKIHVRRHTNEKPFACEFCDMAFTVRVSLKTHVKSKHPDKALQ